MNDGGTDDGGYADLTRSMLTGWKESTGADAALTAVDFDDLCRDLAGTMPGTDVLIVSPRVYEQHEWLWCDSVLDELIAWRSVRAKLARKMRALVYMAERAGWWIGVIARTETCASCDGCGDGDGSNDCERCGGSGYVTRRRFDRGSR